MRLLLFNLATDAGDPILGFTTDWVRALAARVERVAVITMRAGPADLPANVRVRSVGKEKGYSEPRRLVEFYRHLSAALSDDRVEVCFSHMIPIFTVLAAPVLRARRVPIVTWFAHPQLTWTLRAAHHLSDRMVASLPTAYPYRQDKLVVVGQGIDTNLFAPDGSAPDDPPLVLCAGRLSPPKDHPALLRAVALLRDSGHPPFRVVLLGGPAAPRDETYVASLHAQVEARGLEGRVTFEPPVPRTSLPAWYRRCAVHVNLTPAGFGDKVAWEAMACARPCLMANPGFRETLGDYADRLMFRHGDAEDLAARLAAVLAMSSEERATVGRYLREQVVRLHSLGRLADRLVDLFTDLQRR